MNEILITSSALILALLLLRLVFAKKVRRTLIYGAWVLVALRLLIPVQIGQLDFSVLSAAKPVTEVITGVADKQVAGVTEQEAYREILQDYLEKDQTVFTPEVQEHIQSEIDRNVPKEEIAVMIDKVYPEKEVFRSEVKQQIQQQVEQAAAPITLGQIATVVWLVGVGAMAVWFLVVNLGYSRKLKKANVQLECPESPVLVFVSKNAVSPCLVGLFRPVVYLTPGCAASEEIKRHVLAHELTHLRHGDQIWSVVRCVCLCVYWFHPLVWLAAYLSRRDCELACDEGALKCLGEQERIAYGKSLLDVVAQAASPADLLHTATSMNESKKQLKERVNFIVKKPKVSLIAAICLVLICTIVAGCAVAGPKTEVQQTTNPPTEATVPKESTASKESQPGPTEPEASEEISLHFAWSDDVQAKEIDVESGSVLVLRKESSVEQFVSDNLPSDHRYIETMAHYDEEFFREKTLLLAFFKETMDGHSYRFGKIQRQDDGSYILDVDHSQRATCIASHPCYIVRIEINGIIPENASINLNVMETPEGYTRTYHYDWTAHSTTGRQNSSVCYDLLTSSPNLSEFRDKTLGRGSEAHSLLDAYDNDYFKSNALAVFYFCPGDSGRQYVVTDVFLSSDGDCLVYLDCLLPAEQQGSPECYLVCVEINQKVADDASIHYEITEK